MPEAFNKCVKAGGTVRTETLGQGKYRHVCYLKGKRYMGEIKHKRKNR